MSHFTKIKTALKDLDLLKQSLDDLSIQWYVKDNIVKGYKNQITFANIIIPQSNDYDIGFVWNGLEYQLVADLQFWQQPWSVEFFLNKLTQRYAYNSVLKMAKNTGFYPVNEIMKENGLIKLTLQKWRP